MLGMASLQSLGFAQRMKTNEIIFEKLDIRREAVKMDTINNKEKFESQCFFGFPSVTVQMQVRVRRDTEVSPPLSIIQAYAGDKRYNMTKGSEWEVTPIEGNDKIRAVSSRYVASKDGFLDVMCQVSEAQTIERGKILAVLKPFERMAETEAFNFAYSATVTEMSGKVPMEWAEAAHKRCPTCQWANIATAKMPKYTNEPTIDIGVRTEFIADEQCLAI